ncbi:MAG: sulfotransferase [Sphingomonadaceae bacterium]|nr:sulfotransferase [Sphingomonadaceae bacterium]
MAMPPSSLTVIPPSMLAVLASRGLQSAWNSGLLPCPSLAPEILIKSAKDAEGHGDFGPGNWREALEVLTFSLENEANLNPLGRALAYGLLVKSLRERLRATELRRRHPEIDNIPLTAPIVVLGSMRSGTTRLQRLFACDPRLSHTRTFEAMSPAWGQGSAWLRIIKTAFGLAILHGLNPRLAVIHPTAAMAAEEQFGFFNASMISAQFDMQWHVPTYSRWLCSADRKDAYRQFAQLLRIVAWSRKTEVQGPWVLKAPEFMDGLDPLMETFPDARLVYLRREATSVVSSGASLVHQHRSVHSDQTDPLDSGRHCLETTARRNRATSEFFDRTHTPRIETSYDALERDWRDEMRSIYGQLGMTLPVLVENRMSHYLARAQSHRGHNHAPAHFGLDADRIAQRLAHPASP